MDLPAKLTSKPTITITPEELSTAAVDVKVAQRSAVEKARASHREASSKPSRLPVQQRSAFWQNALVSMTLFGLLGGVLAGGLGELLLSINPDTRAQADSMLKVRDQMLLRLSLGELSESQAKNAIRELDDDAAANPYYSLQINASLTENQRDHRIKQLTEQDRLKGILVSLSLYCTWGAVIATALGMAEVLAARNVRKALVFGSVGAAIGLVGGAVITLCLGPRSPFLEGLASRGDASILRQILAHSFSWGLLGLFLSIASGLVMRSPRKLVLGMIGGCLGGTVGGALFDPINQATNNQVLSRIVAVAAIGMLAGFSIAIIENVAKRGWLKVKEGMIAGKQFIIYRNPTIIGSNPHCEIYLFKDDAVLRHHAMVHIVPGGYELEDLGTGRTLVNDRPVNRVRLRNGDKIRIGRTRFDFHETANRSIA